MKEKITCAYELREKLNEKYGKRINTDEFLALMEDMIIGELDQKKISIAVHNEAKSISVLVDETLNTEALEELLSLLKKIMGRAPIFSLRLKQEEKEKFYYAIEWNLKNPKRRVNQLLNGEIYSFNRIKDLTVYK